MLIPPRSGWLTYTTAGEKPVHTTNGLMWRVLGVWFCFVNCLLHTKYHWMTWLPNTDYSKHMGGRDAFPQDVANGDTTERRFFTSWQSWRNFWRSLLSFSLIRSSLAASRFFLCLAKKNKSNLEVGIPCKIGLLISVASLGYIRCISIWHVFNYLPNEGHVWSSDVNALFSVVT